MVGRQKKCIELLNNGISNYQATMKKKSMIYLCHASGTRPRTRVECSERHNLQICEKKGRKM